MLVEECSGRYASPYTIEITYAPTAPTPAKHYLPTTSQIWGLPLVTQNGSVNLFKLGILDNENSHEGSNGRLN